MPHIYSYIVYCCRQNEPIGYNMSALQKISNVTLHGISGGTTSFVQSSGKYRNLKICLMLMQSTFQVPVLITDFGISMGASAPCSWLVYGF